MAEPIDLGPTSDSAETCDHKRCAYETPRLVIHGTVESITSDGGNFGADGVMGS